MKYTMLYLPNGLSDSFFFLFLSISHPFLFLFFLSYSIYLSSFPSSFSISPCSFLSLSLISLQSIPHVPNCLSRLIANSAPSFLSFRPVPVFSLLVPTSKSRHHFSFSHSPPGTPEFPLEYTSHRELYLVSLILSLLSCFSVSFSLSLSSTFIHLHFALNLSLSSLVVRISFSPNSPCSFLFSPAFRQYPALLPSIHSVFKLCRSFFRFHSQPIPLALFPHMEPAVSLSTPSTLLKYFSFSLLFPTHIPLLCLLSSLPL
jgi:hypothetical protein